MKEQRAIPPVPPEYLRALTDEELAKPPCRWWVGHRWVRVDANMSSGCAHYQCAKCCDRWAEQKYKGSMTMPNGHWLQGGAWRDPMLESLPTTKGPVSVVPPRPPASRSGYVPRTVPCKGAFCTFDPAESCENCDVARELHESMGSSK